MNKLHYLDDLKNNHSLSYIFHEKTKNVKIKRRKIKDNFSWRHIYFKEYPRFPHVYLPLKKKQVTDTLRRSLLARRSQRIFIGQALSLDELSQILYFSANIGYLKEDIDRTKRMYPSAGARYPLELYINISKNMEKLKAGIYHYNVKQHSLEFFFGSVKLIHLRKLFLTGQQQMINKASVIIFITAVFARTQIKYGDRGYRYILLEAGHLAQNIHLLATNLRLGCCAIGGFIDDEVNKLLDLEKEKEQVIYVLAVGKLD